MDIIFTYVYLCIYIYTHKRIYIHEVIVYMLQGSISFLGS